MESIRGKVHAVTNARMSARHALLHKKITISKTIPSDRVPHTRYSQARRHRFGAPIV